MISESHMTFSEPKPTLTSTTLRLKTSKETVSSIGDLPPQKRKPNAQFLLLARFSMNPTQESFEIRKLLSHLVEDRAEVWVGKDVLNGIESEGERKGVSTISERGGNEDVPIIDPYGVAQRSTKPNLEESFACKRKEISKSEAKGDDKVTDRKA